MPRHLRVCAAAELAPGQSRLFVDEPFRVAVFNVGGSLFAIDDACPHRQGPLHQGDLEGFLVACPLHGWQFDVRTGACATLSDRDVAAYAARVEGDSVWITLPD